MEAERLEIGDTRPVGNKDKARRDLENRHLAHVVGRNLLFARNLNQLMVVDAQKLLGFASAGSISKLEGGFSHVNNKSKLATARMPPGALDIAYFSRAYGVSADFLLGLSPYPEPDSKERALNEVKAQTNSTIRQFISEATEAILTSNMAGADYEVRLKNYMPVVNELLETLVSFIKLNKADPVWEDVRAGNKLVNVATKAIEAHNALLREIKVDKEAKQREADWASLQAGKQYPLLREEL